MSTVSFDVDCVVPGSFLCGNVRGMDDIAFTWLLIVVGSLFVIFFIILLLATLFPLSWWRRTRWVDGCLKREPINAYDSEDKGFQKFRNKKWYKRLCCDFNKRKATIELGAISAIPFSLLPVVECVAYVLFIWSFLERDHPKVLDHHKEQTGFEASFLLWPKIFFCSYFLFLGVCTCFFRSWFGIVYRSLQHLVRFADEWNGNMDLRYEESLMMHTFMFSFPMLIWNMTLMFRYYSGDPVILQLVCCIISGLNMSQYAYLHDSKALHQETLLWQFIVVVWRMCSLLIMVIVYGAACAFLHVYLFVFWIILQYVWRVYRRLDSMPTEVLVKIKDEPLKYEIINAGFSRRCFCRCCYDSKEAGRWNRIFYANATRLAQILADSAQRIVMFELVTGPGSIRHTVLKVLETPILLCLLYLRSRFKDDFLNDLNENNSGWYHDFDQDAFIQLIWEKCILFGAIFVVFLVMIILFENFNIKLARQNQMTHLMRKRKFRRVQQLRNRGLLVKLDRRENLTIADVEDSDSHIISLKECADATTSSLLGFPLCKIIEEFDKLEDTSSLTCIHELNDTWIKLCKIYEQANNGNACLDQDDRLCQNISSTEEYERIRATCEVVYEWRMVNISSLTDGIDAGAKRCRLCCTNENATRDWFKLEYDKIDGWKRDGSTLHMMVNPMDEPKSKAALSTRFMISDHTPDFNAKSWIMFEVKSENFEETESFKKYERKKREKEELVMPLPCCGDSCRDDSMCCVAPCARTDLCCDYGNMDLVRAIKDMIKDHPKLGEGYSLTDIKIDILDDKGYKKSLCFKIKPKIDDIWPFKEEIKKALLNVGVTSVTNFDRGSDGSIVVVFYAENYVQSEELKTFSVKYSTWDTSEKLGCKNQVVLQNPENFPSSKEDEVEQVKAKMETQNKWLDDNAYVSAAEGCRNGERAEVIAWYDARGLENRLSDDECSSNWVAIGLKNRNQWTIVPEEYLIREADLIPDYGKTNALNIVLHYVVWIPFLIATFPFGMVAITQQLNRRRGEVNFATRSCRYKQLACCLNIDNIIWFISIGYWFLCFVLCRNIYGWEFRPWEIIYNVYYANLIVFGSEVFVEGTCCGKEEELKLITDIDPLEGLKFEQGISCVRVKEVAEGSQADLMGFEVGDSLLSLRRYIKGEKEEVLYPSKECRSAKQVIELLKSERLKAPKQKPKLMEPYYHRVDEIPLLERRWKDGRVYEFEVKRQWRTLCTTIIEGLFRFLGVRSSSPGKIGSLASVKIPLISCLALFVGLTIFAIVDHIQSPATDRSILVLVGSIAASIMSGYKITQFVIKAAVSLDPDAMEIVVPEQPFVTHQILSVWLDGRDTLKYRDVKDDEKAESTFPEFPKRGPESSFIGGNAGSCQTNNDSTLSKSSEESLEDKNDAFYPNGLSFVSEDKKEEEMVNDGWGDMEDKVQKYKNAKKSFEKEKGGMVQMTDVSVFSETAEPFG